MIFNVYSLRDKVSGQFRDLTINTSDEVAKRDLAYAVNNDSRFQFMAKDFELYKIGQFDTENGEMKPKVPIDMVIQADQLIGA